MKLGVIEMAESAQIIEEIFKLKDDLSNHWMSVYKLSETIDDTRVKDLFDEILLKLSLAENCLNQVKDILTYSSKIKDHMGYEIWSKVFTFKEVRYIVRPRLPDINDDDRKNVFKTVDEAILAINDRGIFL